jgi:hypothetical protein
MEYVSQVTLDVNGKSITDFKTFTENEIELNKEVRLMNKTGFMGVTPRFGCKVDYVIPQTNPEIDWSTVRNGRLSVEFENGRRITYTGVTTLKIGEMKVDGENETVRTIELGATGRVEE